jgi:hypothetical protein
MHIFHTDVDNQSVHVTSLDVFPSIFSSLPLIAQAGVVVVIVLLTTVDEEETTAVIDERQELTKRAIADESSWVR